MRGVLMKRKRARTKRGRYKADDKKTKFNEAWIAKRPSWIVKKWRRFIKWYLK